MIVKAVVTKKREDVDKFDKIEKEKCCDYRITKYNKWLRVLFEWGRLPLPY